MEQTYIVFLVVYRGAEANARLCSGLGVTVDGLCDTARVCGSRPKLLSSSGA